MSMEDLSSVLWRERELLEMLLFKLEVEQMVLEHGRSRWLAPAAREIETVLDSIRETELLRAVATDAAAAELDLEPDPSLSRLAEASAEPWQGMLLDHREAFSTVAAQITNLAQSNRALLTSGYQAAQVALDVAGANVANAGRAGYTRRMVLAQPVGAPVTPAMWSRRDSTP